MFLQEVKNDSGSVVAKKLSKVKDKFTRKKKKTNLEDSKSQKFSSNGSLLSQNGLKTNFAGSTDLHKSTGLEKSIFLVRLSCKILKFLDKNAD